MRPSLRYALFATDILFLAYWVVAGLAELGLVSLAPSLMYSGYGDARVCAWNWSFFPIDVAFSISGLLAARWGRRNDPRWRPAALVSLTLTMVAGLMAVSYWGLLGEFVMSWFVPNLVLLLWPIPYLATLLSEVAQLGRVASSSQAR